MMFVKFYFEFHFLFLASFRQRRLYSGCFFFLFFFLYTKVHRIRGSRATQERVNEWSIWYQCKQRSSEVKIMRTMGIDNNWPLKRLGLLCSEKDPCRSLFQKEAVIVKNWVKLLPYKWNRGNTGDLTTWTYVLSVKIWIAELIKLKNIAHLSICHGNSCSRVRDLQHCVCGK